MTDTQAPKRETRIVSEGFVKRLTAGPGQFFLAIGACLLLVLAVFLITPREQTGELRPAIDYSLDARALARAAPYVVYAPVDPPQGWRANSSRLTGLTDPQKKKVSWHLGFATPSGGYASVEQSNEPADGPRGFVRRMTNVYQSSPTQSLGVEQLNGMSWDKYSQKDKIQDSYVARLPKSTVIVTGTIGWAELQQLVNSLKAQPLGGE